MGDAFKKYVDSAQNTNPEMDREKVDIMGNILEALARELYGEDVHYVCTFYHITEDKGIFKAVISDLESSFHFTRILRSNTKVAEKIEAMIAEHMTEKLKNVEPEGHA